jgi:hypothetical protein
MLATTLDYAGLGEKVMVWEYRVWQGLIVGRNNEEISIGQATPRDVSPPNLDKQHWLTFSSQKRHNQNCSSNYGKTNGRWCTPNEGVACRNCGG